jgi:hypothetical protein
MVDLQKQTAASQTPPNNPQSEDLLTKQAMARADLRPPEQRTANWFEFPEATRNGP